MPRLIETSACEGLLPVILPEVGLSELPFAPVTSVAPFAGKEKAVGTALKKLGLGWPGPGQSVRAGEAACLWTGRGQAFLVAAAPQGLAGLAALTDPSDGWARVRLQGPGAEAVLSRPVPLDLPAPAFLACSVARRGHNHFCLFHTHGAPAPP